jgi:hypothetical protein
MKRTQLDQIFGLYFTIASFSSVIFSYIVETYSFNVVFTHIAAVSAISLIPAFFIQESRNLEEIPTI